MNYSTLSRCHFISRATRPTSHVLASISHFSCCYKLPTLRMFSTQMVDGGIKEIEMTPQTPSTSTSLIPSKIATEIALRHADIHAQCIQQNALQLQSHLLSHLDHFQKQAQTFRKWIRDHKDLDGTMSPKNFKESIPDGVGMVQILSSKNNTFVTLMDSNHKVLRSISGGMCGLKGCQRGTSEAGTRAASIIAGMAKDKQIVKLFVKLKGFGVGREAAFRSLIASGITILRIEDVTPVAHGGCRPKKARRV